MVSNIEDQINTWKLHGIKYRGSQNIEDQITTELHAADLSVHCSPHVHVYV